MRAAPALVVIFASVCAAVLGSAPVAAASSLRVTHRFALVMAHHDGGPGRAHLQHSDDDARAIRDVLVDLAHVDSSDVRFLVDGGANDVSGALDDVKADVGRAKAAGERAEVVVYYSGHSDENGLLLGDTRLSWTALKARVTAIDADVKVVVLDSCASGAAVKKKGGTRRPPLLVDDKVAVHGQAFLTSSSADEASQESARLGGSYFTHALVTGLRGAADVSKDGLVTLDEAYRFAFHETLATTTTTTGGAQHATWDIQLTGAGEWVLTDLRDVKSRLILGDDVNGRVFVRDAKERTLLAEVTKTSGSSLPLALPRAEYDVIVVDGHLAEQALSKGGTLSRKDFHAVDLEEAVPRGDLPITHFPINISFISPLEANSAADRVENQLGLALLFGRSARLSGVDLAVGGNYVDERVRGGMLAIGFNGANGPVSGAMLAASNLALSDVNGVMGGVFNLGTGVLRGAQIGLVNVGNVVDGAQVGLINIADTAAAQVGLINISSSTTAPVGVLSLVKDGQASIGVTGSDFALVGAEARVGGRYLWTELKAGVNPLLSTTPLAVLGGGFGGTVELGDTVFGDGFIDVSADVGVVGSKNVFGAAGARLRLRPAPFVQVSAGPELRLLDATGLNATRMAVPVADHVVLWPGVVVGVSL